MTCKKIAFAIVGAFTVIFLTGCDKLKEFAELKSELIAAKLEVAEVKSQLAAIRARLDNVETLATKPSVTAEVQTPPKLEVEVLKATIEKCVEVVHSNAPADDSNNKFYSGFDAFYNVASGRVQDNNQYVGGMPAKYMFQKCMSKNGWPLS